ncbi:MAG: hypothetical protein PHS54_04520, partial [Clostridia bacterium]|nr:hypothetical protein [Clostridia bacterium]
MIEIRYPHIIETINLNFNRVFTLVIENPKMLYKFGYKLLKTLSKEKSNLYFVKNDDVITNF